MNPSGAPEGTVPVRQPVRRHLATVCRQIQLSVGRCHCAPHQTLAPAVSAWLHVRDYYEQGCQGAHVVSRPALGAR